MFNFFRNYDKPGKGVSENEAKKKGIFLFFDVIRHNFTHFIMLNALFIITSIPIVTVGPSFAALTYVLKSFADNEHSWGASDYFSAFKRYFKKGFIAGIVFLLFGFGIGYNLIYFAFVDSALATYMTWLLAALSVIYCIVHCYLYTLMVSSDESVLELFTDAFILALAKLPLNVLALIGIFLYPIIILAIYFAPFIPMQLSSFLSGAMFLFTMFSFVQFAAVIYTRSVIRKLK